MPSTFEKALAVGRPPNISRLFPNSKALIVSGKAIDRAMVIEGIRLVRKSGGKSGLYQVDDG